MKYEYTDTFGGETNYSWVHRGELPNAKSLHDALRQARKELGLTGVKGDILYNFGDAIHWRPRGMCTLLMITWSE